MSDRADEIAAAKANFSSALTSTKQEAVTTVAEAKSALLQEPLVPALLSPDRLSQDLLRQKFSDTAVRARKDFLESLPDPKRVIKTENNIQYLADGTYNLISATGEILRNVNKKEIPNLLRLEEVRSKDLKKQERLGMRATPLTGLGAIGVDLLGKITGGAAELGSDITGIGTSSRTLTEEVDKYNRDFSNRYSKATISESLRLDKETPPDSISKEELLKYQQAKKAMRKDAPLSSADIEYINSKKFNTIAGLESNVYRSSQTFDKIEEISKSIQDQIPTEQREGLAVSLAYKRVAKDKGTLTALWKTLTEDWQYLARAGFESIPYMVAFTAGGPLTQSGVLYTLAKSKAREITDIFIKEHGRDPDNNEQLRIDFFSGASTVAEKFGDMAAVKAIPFAKLGRATGILKQATKDIPDTVQRALNKTSFVGQIGKGSGRVAKALGGEGLSGGLTSSFDQLAESGKITDESQVFFDALAEAVGTVGGIGGIVAGKTAYNIAALPFKPNALQQRITDLDNRIASDDPVEFGATSKGAETGAEFIKVQQELKNLKENKEQNVATLADEILTKTREEGKRSLFEEEESKEKAERLIDRNIEKLENKRNELFETLKAPVSAEEVTLYKEDLASDKEKIIQESKRREQDKEKRKYAKTKEGKDLRIKEIDVKLASLKKAEGFRDTQAIQELEREKEDLVSSQASLLTKVKNTFVDSPEETPTAIDDEDVSPIDDPEFEEFKVSLRSKDIQSTGDYRERTRLLNDALDNIATLYNTRILTEKQVEEVEEIIQQITEVEPGEDKGILGSLKNVEELSDVDLDKKIKKADTDKNEADSKLLKTELGRRAIEKEIEVLESESKAEATKTMGEVGAEVEEGGSVRWKGIVTYFREIIKAETEMEDPVAAESAIDNIFDKLVNHTNNLTAKAKAFTTAYNMSAPSPGYVNVVTGDVKSVNGQRVMTYSPQTISVAAYTKLRESGKYVNALVKKGTITKRNPKNLEPEIDSEFDFDSQWLINKVTKEAEYGKAHVELVTGFKESSFKDAALEKGKLDVSIKKKQTAVRRFKFKEEELGDLTEEEKKEIDKKIESFGEDTKEYKKYLQQAKYKLRNLRLKKETTENINKQNAVINYISNKESQFESVGKVGKVGKVIESLQDRMTAKIVTVIKKTAKRWLPKEQTKTKIATQFIGEGNPNSSTARYAKMYADEGLANTGKYTSDDVIFIASNGTVERNGKVTREGIPPVVNGKLQGEYTNITAAIAAGATIVMDTRQHIINTNKEGRTFKNAGELALARYLAANGYERQGGTGVWKPSKTKAKAVTVEGASIEDVLNSEESGLINILDPGKNTTEMLKEKIKTLEHLLTHGETPGGRKVKDGKRGTVAEQMARFRANLTAARLQLKYTQREDTDEGTGITPDMIRHMTVQINKAKKKLSEAKEGSEEHSKLKAEIAETEGKIQKLLKEDPDLAADLQVTVDEVIEDETIEIDPEPPAPNTDESKRPTLFTTEEGTEVKANNGQWVAIEKIKNWWSSVSKREDDENKIFVLSGRGGTGKTTLVEATLDALGIASDEVKFALPTHKAKQVIQNATQGYSEDNFSTIDSLLGQKPKWVPVDAKGNIIGIQDKKTRVKEYIQIFVKDESDDAEAAADNKLKGVKLIVIDEASMINEKFTSELIEIAKDKNIRLLFMGDNVQLPPIEDESETKVKGSVTVSWVFDTVMKIFQKPNKLPIPETSYAELTKRMRQGEESPILGITDILANVVEHIHENHKKYVKDFGKTKLVSFVLPFIKSNDVEYMDGTVDRWKKGSKGISYGEPGDEAVESFAKEYLEAKENNNEKNVKFITYNAAGHETTRNLRKRIRKLIFPDVDPKKAEDLEGTPFLAGERIVLDKDISAFNPNTKEVERLEDLHNGDEVTVQEEVYDGTINDKASGVTGIPVHLLKVKTDDVLDKNGKVIEKGKAYTLVLNKINKDETTPWGAFRSFSEDYIFNNLSASQKDQGIDKKLKAQLFTSGLGAAYVINSHKAQGSTYDTVYVDYNNILEGKHKADFLTRVKSLYVATSRPRNRLVLVGRDISKSFGQGKQLKKNEIIANFLKSGKRPKSKSILEIAEEKVKELQANLKKENKKTSIKINNDLKSLASTKGSSSETPVISFNLTAIVKDYENNLSYLDGKGVGIHEATSKQKEKVLESVNVEAFKQFIIENGGIEKYIEFIYQHEIAHIINKDSNKYPRKKDGSIDLMNEKAIAIEQAANNFAFDKIGFKNEPTTDTKDKVPTGETPVSGKTPPVPSKKPVGPVGRKISSGKRVKQLTEKEIKEQQELEKELKSDDESRKIDEGSLNKEALHVLFPEIISADGKLLDEKTLKKHEQLVLLLQNNLGVESIEEVESRLNSLPANQNFIDSNKDNLSSTPTEEELREDKTKLTKKYPGQKTVAQRLATNLEYVFDILGKKLDDLIGSKTVINKKIIKSINTLPNEVFRGITDSTGRKQYKSLERALVALGTTEETASEIAKEYSRFQRKYEVIHQDPEGELNKVILPINRPLSVFYAEGTLPPQVIFTLMLTTLNWVKQKPNNIRFSNSFDREIFLYKDHHNLTSDEHREINGIAHDRNDAFESMGRDALSLLNMSPKQDVYYDNLTLALGMLAAQIEHGNEKDTKTGASYVQPIVNFEEDTPRFHMEVKLWKFDEPSFKPGRSYNNSVTDKDIKELLDSGLAKYVTDSATGKKIIVLVETNEQIEPGFSNYHHIKLNLERGKNNKEIPFKFSKESLSAQDNLFEVIEASIERDGDKPAQKPYTSVVDTIRGVIGGVPKFNKLVIGLLQKVAWTNSQSLDIAAKLANAGYKDILHKLDGVTELDEFDHIRIVESVEASNADKINSLEALLNAYSHKDGNLLKKFYFKYQLQNQHRLLMQASGNINPQASGISRYYVRPTKASVKFNKDNIWKFKLAVTQMLGFATDKSDLTGAEEAFDTLIKHENILNAVDAIQRIDEKGQAKRLAELLLVIKADAENGRLVGNPDHPTSILNGLTGLAQGLTIESTITEAGEFLSSTLKTDSESDVAFEIDGISNGLAQNIFQFPMLGKEGNAKIQEQTGTLSGATAKSTEFDPTDKQDVYQETGSAVEKFATIDWAEAHYEKDFKKDRYITSEIALNNLWPTLKNGDMRKVIKYPFLIFMYGGGFRSITEGIAEDVLHEIYVQFNTASKEYADLLKNKASSAVQQEYTKEVIDPLLLNLINIGAITSTQKNTIRTQFINGNREALSTVLFNDKRVISNIAYVLRPRLEQGLLKMLGATKEARDAVVQAGEVLYKVFIAHYKKAYNEALIIRDENGNDTNSRRPDLTEREINKLIKDKLIEVFPQARGPLSQIGEEFIDLTKRKRSDNPNAAEKTGIEYIKSDGKKGTTESAPSTITFVEPGVTALIRMIINMDSSILTKTLSRYPNVLALHDAVFGDPETLEGSSKEYGKNYINFNEKYGVLEALTTQMHKVLEYTKKEDAALYREIEEDVLNNAFQNRFKTEDKSSLDNIVYFIDEVTKGVKLARKEDKEERAKNGKTISNQLYMATKRIYETVEDLAEAASIKKLLHRLVDISLGEQTPKQEKPTAQEKEDAINEEKFKAAVLDSKLDDRHILHSLDDLDKGKKDPEKEYSTSLKEDNIMSVFKDMVNVSDDYYASEEEKTQHTEVLENLLATLARGLNHTSGIKFTQYDIDGITQAEFDKYKGRIKLFLNKKRPLTLTAQSPQEMFVHETVHATTIAALAKSPLLKKRVEKLFLQTKRELAKGDGYKIFLTSIPGGAKNASKQDEIMAKHLYRYIFENVKNEQYKLDEFLAYAVTNKEFIKYLSSTKSKIHLSYNKEDRKFAQAVDVFKYMFELAVDVVLRLVGKRGGLSANAHHEMLAVLNELIEIQVKHKTRFQLFQEKIGSISDSTDKFLQNFAEETGKAWVNRDTTNKLDRAVRIAVGSTYINLSNSADMQAYRQRLYGVMNQTLRDITFEIGEGALSPQLIRQLLQSKVNVSKARQEVERFTTEWFNNIWKSVDGSKQGNISANLREHMTSVIFRTDLSSLRKSGFSHAEIASFLSNENKRNIELRNLKRKILQTKTIKGVNPRDVVNYAEELGNYMATGNTEMHLSAMNASSLSDRSFVTSDDNSKAMIDAYATLTAVKETNPTEVRNVNKLVQAEFVANSTENGFIDLIDAHIEYVERSKQGLFDDNATQMVKGYVIERIDNLTEMRAGTAAQQNQMAKEGLPNPFTLKEIPGVPRVNDTLYVGTNNPPVPYVSAIMSTTNKRNIGTTLTDILSEDPKYQLSPGVPNMRAINKAIKKVIAEETKRSKGQSRNSDLQLRPVYDEKNKITDFRVIMNHNTRKKLLNPDVEIQNVFAHMQSSYIDRVNTITHDKRTVELLVHEQKERLPSYPREFVDFLDPANGFTDRYYRLPKEVRMYIEKFTKNGKFMVRKDVVNKVFGYQPSDLRNIKFLQHPRMAHGKRFAGLLHYFLRQIVNYGKDRIVIAMPQVWVNNALSNIFQLTMRNIPISYTVHKLIEGFQEYQGYRNDVEERRKLLFKINIKKLNKQISPEALQVEALNVRIENNRIHRMSVLGLNSLIVEDLNDASLDGYVNRGRRVLKTQKWYEKPSKSLEFAHDVAASIFMTRSTGPYQLMRQIVQMTDFLARYVMIEHATQVRGIPFEEAAHEALDAFVLFDEALAPALEAMDAIGATVFLSYFLRNQRASRKLAMSNPTGVALSGAFQYSTGIPTLGNVNSSFLAGDISPNVMYLDELFDEANNPTGADLLERALDGIFN